MNGNKSFEELNKSYNPEKAQRWYQFWEKENFFHAAIDENKRPFIIMIPPPNVTGSLHMGHALNNTIQDVLARKKRMDGDVVLWLPGTDHAGIATQNVVEKQLLSEKKTRHDLGREEFIERVWQWKDEYGSTIINQLKTLGCSCDWQRERFTMDEGYTKAVKKVFVDLYHQKLIYRSNRIINWCPRCHTALSDIEVEHKDIEGSLWYIKYPIKSPQPPFEKGGQKGDLPFITVATTRPETMLGDTAVAVNPSDKRYSHLIGKKAVLPLVGREIPIVGDDFVDPSFGTGAVKVTPAHDPNDYEIGQRHNLETVNIFNESAQIVNVPKYDGLDRFDARKKVVEDLEKEGLLEKVEKHTHAIGHCYRCHTIVEPYLSLQWFVDMRPLVKPAIEVVREDKVSFWPPRWAKLYFSWMENIKDWCISRQIWWGHQIPAWYCECGEVIVQLDAPEKCGKCASQKLTQDEDVLDTWFSSALWPFATLGWPDKTGDLQYFYPTSVLVTARDILYFWVARMIMTGLKFMGDIPFHTVVINPTVLNWEGKRMSKSLGTGLDPVDYINIYGTDALRFGLMYQVTEVQDMRFTEDKLEMSRNFANKIWNASRYILSAGEDMSAEPDTKDISEAGKWIISLMRRTVEEVTRSIDTYRFGEACQRLYGFFWSDFCDWYLEISKEELQDPKLKQSCRWVLLKVLDTSLKLLHPFMPFITEEVWQRLPQKEGKSICITKWPAAEEFIHEESAIGSLELVKSIVTDIRRLRSEVQVPQKQLISCMLSFHLQDMVDTVDRFSSAIKRLAKVKELTVGIDISRPKGSIIMINPDYELYILLEAVDMEQTISRLKTRLKQVENEIEMVEKKLANEQFVSKAPANVVEKEKNKLEAYSAEKQKIIKQLKLLHD